MKAEAYQVYGDMRADSSTGFGLGAFFTPYLCV